MQDWQEWTDIHGTPLAPDQAWRRMFDDWKTAKKEIGLRFISQLGHFGTFGTLRSARQGTIQIESDSTAATFDLKEVRFTWGPMQTWPHWPNPPVVEVIAWQAYLPRGAWLVMVEDWKPEAIPMPQLTG